MMTFVKHFSFFAGTEHSRWHECCRCLDLYLDHYSRVFLSELPIRLIHLCQWSNTNAISFLLSINHRHATSSTDLLARCWWYSLCLCHVDSCPVLLLLLSVSNAGYHQQTSVCEMNVSLSLKWFSFDRSIRGDDLYDDSWWSLAVLLDILRLHVWLYSSAARSLRSNRMREWFCHSDRNLFPYVLRHTATSHRRLQELQPTPEFGNSSDRQSKSEERQETRITCDTLLVALVRHVHCHCCSSVGEHADR